MEGGQQVLFAARTDDSHPNANCARVFTCTVQCGHAPAYGLQAPLMSNDLEGRLKRPLAASSLVWEPRSIGCHVPWLASMMPKHRTAPSHGLSLRGLDVRSAADGGAYQFARIPYPGEDLAGSSGLIPTYLVSEDAPDSEVRLMHALRRLREQPSNASHSWTFCIAGLTGERLPRWQLLRSAPRPRQGLGGMALAVLLGKLAKH